MRVLRLGRIIAFLNVRNEIKMSLKLLKLIFFLTIYLHWLGCAWFLIVDENKEWLPPLDYVWVGTNFYEQDVNYQYWLSLYHAVLILTGGDVGPRGWYQTAFISFFIVVGAIINANMFGELAVIVAHLNRKSAQFHERLDIVNTAMKNLRIPEELQKKIVSFVTYTHGLLESK